MQASPAPLSFTGVTVRNLTRQPVRTVLTAVGVATGVIAVVALAGVSNGFWQQTDDALHLAGTDLMVFQANQAADIFSTLEHDDVERRLRSIKGVRETSCLLWALMRVSDNPFALVVGIDPNSYSFPAIIMKEGRRPEADDEVLLGRIARRTLHANVGDAVGIGGRSFRVCGVFEGSVVAVDAGVLLRLNVLQELTGRPGKVTSAMVRLDAKTPVAEAVKAIEAANPDLVAISEVTEYSKVDRGLLVVRNMVWAVSAIAVIVGAMVVLNTMWMSVFERTREIGILRALGWTRKRIVLMVLTESATIGVIAAVLGSLIGVGLAQLSGFIRFTEQFVSPRFDWTIFAMAGVISLVIGAAGGLIPSWRASTFSPAEALRYE